MEIQTLNNIYLTNMDNIIYELNNYIILFGTINNSLDDLNNYEQINNLKNIKYLMNKNIFKDIDTFLNDTNINS